MRKNRMLLTRIRAALFCLIILAGAGGAVPATASQDSTPTVIYEDSFNYTCWDSAFFAADGIWSKETPQFGNNASFTSISPLVEDGVMKLSEGMSAQFNWTRLSDRFTFDSANTYTLTFDISVKDFGDDQPLAYSANWKREFYFAAAGWYNQIEFQSDHAVGCIRTGNAPDDQSTEARAGTKDVDYLLNIPYSAEMIWEPSTGTVTTIVKQGDTVISSGSRTNTTDFTHADSYCSNWVFRCEDGEVWVDNVRITDGTNIYTQTFEPTDSASGMAHSGVWSLETARVEPDAMAPELADGAVKLTTGTSILFDWYNLMERSYDPDQTYTFSFDFKLTDEGSGAIWGSSNITRALYVGSGGWYNHIELLGTSQPYASVRAGDTYAPYEQSVYLNQTVHSTLVWKGDTITTILYDAGGNLLLAGYRINSDFTSMTVENGAMTYLVLRCEDGAVEIDNFSFSIGGTDENAIELLDTALLEIPGDQQGVFACNIDYTAGDHPSLRLGDTELFSLADGSLRLCGCQVAGNYPEGTYGLRITVNPAQKMLSVDLTLPDGGTVRRGTCDQVSGSGYTLNLYGQYQEAVSDISVSYEGITTHTYTLNTTEPVATGFQANVYNLVSSFDDARTTRNFAWTALRGYLGADTMAVRYRLWGDEDWTSVEAQVEAGSFINSAEVYLKADITGLDEASTYQYQIGKPDSDDWSEIYTFTTAPEHADTFSFVALGDTQGNSWADYRPLMLTQAAYREALEATPDAAFILHTGDVVENGTIAGMWNRFFKALGNYGASIPHFSAIGNHDALQVSSEFYFDLHFNHPNNGGTSRLDPAYTSRLPSGSDLAALTQRADETFYSFNYGDAHFIVLNSGTYTAADQYLLEAQRAWLISDLQFSAHAKWTVVLVHEPVYHRRGGSESRPWLYDVIEGYGVDLVIQGHSHLVTRSYPMKNGAIVTKENPDTIVRGSGTVYTTIGSTTSTHDSMGNPNMEEMMLIKTPASEQAAYTSVTVSDTRLTVTLRQLDGLVLDQFTISGPSPAARHYYTAAVTAPTCTEDGYTTYTCQCGDTYVSDYVDALGHAYETVTVDATCTADGSVTSTCVRCNKTTVEVIPALGHTYESDITAPTCTEDGYTTHTCTLCGEVVVDEIVAALDHTYESVTVDATCTAGGFVTYTCHCGDSYTEVIPDLGHSYETVVTAPTCTEQGYTTYTCANCGDSYVSDCTDPIDHVYVDGYCQWCGAGEQYVRFSTYTTSLGGNIAMNFYMELSEDLLADPNAYMQFTFAGRTVKVPLSEGKEDVKNGVTVYMYACPITSKNMSDEITAQVVNKSGNVGESKTMAVDTYCNWIIANYSDEKTINLMKAMLNYGASAQMLFNHNTDDLANAALSEEDKILTAVDASEFMHTRTGEEEGIEASSYTLLLDSETTVRCYFVLTGDKTIDEFTFTVDGVEVQPQYKDGRYYIEKKNIAAHRLDDMHIFTCGGITIEYGGLSYVNQVMTYYTSGTTFDMAVALYRYSQASEAYIA